VNSFRIGDWLVEPLQNYLARGDTRVKLDPKVMQVLLYLAERPNEVAEKEKVIESVWAGTFVTDEVLTNAIFELRKALGDDAKDPRYIQTVPRKGYRLLAHVHAPIPSGRGPARVWPAIAALIGILAASAWFLKRNEQPRPDVKVTPLTGFPGAEWWPALAPDGERVAYVWDGAKGGAFDLYVQLIGSADPLRLTDTPAHEYAPAWSPDGKKIAFLRETDDQSEILILPALGGPERRLGAVDAVDLPGGGFNPGLAWSPDGRLLAVVDRPSPRDPRALFLVSVESGEKRQITSGPRDTLPSFSRDGKTLAFARWNEIYLQPLEGGDPQLLTTVEGWITDLDWTPDDRGIAFVAGTESQAGTSLFRVPVTGGAPESLSFGEMAHTISIAAERGRMVFDRRSWFNTDIWRIDGPASKEHRAPSRIFSSSRLDWAQEYSPDGSKIALASERNGRNNIWVCESDGTACFQLTEMVRAGWPRWSPDGTRLVFFGLEGDETELYIADVERRFSRLLTRGGSLASWSHDGRWIYFTSEFTSERQIWKIPAAGGVAKQITQNGGMNPRESEDGRFVYYANGRRRCEIRRVPAESGEERTVIREPLVHCVSWTLWGNRVVYATGAPQDRVGDVETLDLETGQVEHLFSSEAVLGDGISISSDGRSILVSLGEPEVSDIILVEGFR
jgi:Tol biopolymer transport system component/DNA-binding winged helix-turn-helix (wHTH) protein